MQDEFKKLKSEINEKITQYRLGLKSGGQVASDEPATQREEYLMNLGRMEILNKAQEWLRKMSEEETDDSKPTIPHLTKNISVNESFSMNELISEIKNAKPDKIAYMSEVYESTGLLMKTTEEFMDILNKSVYADFGTDPEYEELIGHPEPGSIRFTLFDDIRVKSDGEKEYRIQGILDIPVVLHDVFSLKTNNKCLGSFYDIKFYIGYDEETNKPVYEACPLESNELDAIGIKVMSLLAEKQLRGMTPNEAWDYLYKKVATAYTAYMKSKVNGKSI